MNQLEITFPKSDQKVENRVSAKVRREQRNRQEAQLSSDGKYFVIRLTKGKETKIDAEDIDKVTSHRWTAAFSRGRCYARRALYLNGKRRNILMARLFMGEPKGMQIDHINGDSLDNRKSNLRICTHRENHYAFRTRKLHCTSKYRGVHWHKPRHKWLAQIGSGGTNFHIGLFKSEIEAAIARDFFSHMLFGKFAQINIK